MVHPLGTMGNLYKSLVLLISMLVSSVSAEPFHCPEVRNVIPACKCEARVFNNVEIHDQIVINCRNLNLTSVPPITGSFDHDIYEMTLAQNNIQSLPSGGFDGLKIQRLDLRKNRLRTFFNDSFQGLENDLKELYLGAENGANIPPPVASFTSLGALKTLHLEYFTFPNNEITVGSLNLLTSLTSLTLRFNQLRFLDGLSLPTSLTFLTLDHQDLSSLPIDMLRHLPQLENLTISNTLIAALTRQAFESNSNLKQLDLGYNKIATLDAKCFEGITSSLQMLSLQNNPIPSVTILNEIKQLTALINLQLSEITLTSLPAGADFLSNKGSLTTLSLDGNALTTLGPNVFNNLGNLEELRLARNQLASWDEQVFAGLSSLKYLDLGHQTFPPQQSLTLPESLTSLPSLWTLKLTRNTLNQTTLWPKISIMGSLKVLFLDGTSLTSIPDYAFRNLTQLEELNLDNNGLTEITQVMLAGPRSLKKLTLNKNKITTISQCAFYGFTLSSPLSLELLGNPLACDCKLRWLLTELRAGNITLTTELETCKTPADKDGTKLNEWQPEDFVCISAEPDISCLELYTTPEPPVSSSAPSSVLGLNITNVSSTSITISWTVTNFPTISHFKVKHLNLETSESDLSPNIGPTDRSYQVAGLTANTDYSMCIWLYVSSDADMEAQSCRTTRTLSSGSTEELEDDDQSEIGIIVGTIVAAVVLIAIITAILYLVCLRRRKSKDLPDPPHVFPPSELPTMTANSRHFSKPKEKQPPKVGRALDENIKVTVISDGHTAPVSPRHSVGSYQFLDEKHPNPHPEMEPKDFNYSNDVDSRPLPTAPYTSSKSFYNGGLQPTHTYNEIDK